MRLAEYLRAEGLTQQAFGEVMGTSIQNVHRWLRGVIPSPESMVQIVRATGGRVRPEDFYPDCEPYLGQGEACQGDATR